MSQYNQAQLISASNATYVTNITGQITAADVRTLNTDWISSSALVAQTNTFLGNQIISGSLTASLQTGYIWVGNGSNTTLAVPTSSLQTNITVYSIPYYYVKLKKNIYVKLIV